MTHSYDNLAAFDSFRIDVGTHSVAGQMAYIPGQSYEAVRPSRTKRDRPQQGGSGNAHLCKATLYELQQISLEMDRNNGLSIRMLDAAVEQILGDCGFVLVSQADGDDLQKQIQDDYWDWLSNVCDPAQELHGIQRLYNIERAKHQLGGSFIQWDDEGGDGEGQFYVIEATRCVTPFDSSRRAGETINGYPLINGVARDKRTKKAQFYWIADEEPETAYVQEKDGRAYPADDIIHYYTPPRESMTRGLPVNTPLIKTYDNVDDILELEMLGLKAAAACSLNIETANPADTAAWQQYLAEQNGQEAGSKIEEWNGFEVTYTRKGEQPKVLQSTRPALEVQEFIVKLVRMVGLPMAIPYEWLMLDFTGRNLGVLRVLMQVIQRTWRRHQFNHGCFQSKLFLRWLERQIARGRYPDRPDIRRHTWNAPTWPSPQPVQDATANKIKIEGGWGSEEDAAAQDGKQIERVIEQRARYQKAAPKRIEQNKPGPQIDKNGNPDQSGGTP